MDDQRLVDAVARAGRVVMVELLTGKRQPISDAQGRHVGMVWVEESVPPFAALANAATGLATFPLPKEGAAAYQFWAFKDSTDQAPTLPAVALQLYARGQLAALLDRIRVAAPAEAAQLPSLEAAFSDPAQLRNLMRGLRAIHDSFPEAPGAAAGPRVSSIGLERALQALYAGPAGRPSRASSGAASIRWPSRVQANRARHPPLLPIPTRYPALDWLRPFVTACSL